MITYLFNTDTRGVSLAFAHGEISEHEGYGLHVGDEFTLVDTLEAPETINGIAYGVAHFKDTEDKTLLGIFKIVRKNFREKQPKPPPADWHLHIERDVAWMLRDSATADDRKRYAARILDMIYRVRQQR